MNFGYINGADGGRTGVTLSEPSVGAVKILDTATYAERAKALRELAGMYDPPAVGVSDRDWISVEPESWGRAKLTIHGKSAMLVGKPDVDLPAVAAVVAPNLAARLFRIEDDMPDVEGQDPIPNSVLADTITPRHAHTLDAEPGPEPSVRRPLAAAEWQCVASALGLAVAMLESNSPEVIRAAQALAVSKVHELRS